MAPEVLGGEKHNSESDIYSLGLMFWEMWYRKRAFENLVQFNVTREGLFRWVHRGDRPEVSEKPFSSDEILAHQWNHLMELCWRGDPKIRITATECLREIVKINKVYDAPQHNGRDQKNESSV